MQGVCASPFALGVGGAEGLKQSKPTKVHTCPAVTSTSKAHIWFQLAPTTGNVPQPFCGEGGMGGCGVGLTFGQRKGRWGVAEVVVVPVRRFFFVFVETPQHGNL